MPPTIMVTVGRLLPLVPALELPQAVAPAARAAAQSPTVSVRLNMVGNSSFVGWGMAGYSWVGWVQGRPGRHVPGLDLGALDAAGFGGRARAPGEQAPFDLGDEPFGGQCDDRDDE